jgi:SpoVK/Ycf46/Vps4 family AAA+-type ATPase
MDQRLFDYILTFPDRDSEDKYNSLIGVDDAKVRLEKESILLLNPTLLATWSIQKHGRVIPLVKLVENRHALFIMAGDVGTGKTTLAETFGNHLALTHDLHITLFRLSLSTRGNGSVGDMTHYLSQAFQEILKFTDQLKNYDGTYASSCILLIDEADALAQSRDEVKMQHEDRAGVDGLIQGIDRITKAHVPVLTVMCTNRLSAIDPAVRRRAAAIFIFNRPDEEQRYGLFKTYLEGTAINDDQLRELAKLTGPNETRKYGYTYSDLIQTLLPALVLDTYPSEEITIDRVKITLAHIPPTPPIDQR